MLDRLLPKWLHFNSKRLGNLFVKPQKCLSSAYNIRFIQMVLNRSLLYGKCHFGWNISGWNTFGTTTFFLDCRLGSVIRNWRDQLEVLRINSIAIQLTCHTNDLNNIFHFKSLQINLIEIQWLRDWLNLICVYITLLELNLTDSLHKCVYVCASTIVVGEC